MNPTLYTHLETNKTVCRVTSNGDLIFPPRLLAFVSMLSALGTLRR